MSDSSTLEAHEIAERLAEHRLDFDRIRSRIQRAAMPEQQDRLPAHHFGPYLVIARQAGAGGGALARQVGEELGWPVLDGEIVDLIADAYHLDAAMLHTLDEAESNWVREVIVETIPERVVNLDTYVHHLGRVLRLVALHGHVVLVGRGAHLFLPRERGLAVRVVAREQDRIDWTSRANGGNREAARHRVEEMDRRRAGFIRHYFNRDVNDPVLYDMVVNASLMSTDELVDAVVHACRRRGLDEPVEP